MGKQKAALPKNTGQADPQNKEQTPEANLLESIQSEVSKEASPLLDFLATHARLIFLFLVTLIVLIFAAGIWNYHSSSKTKAQEEALGKILIRPDTPAKLADLEQFAATAEGGMKDAALLALTHSAVKQGDQERALLGWRRVATMGNASLSLIAGLGEAGTLARLGKPAEGIARLEGMIPAATPEERALLSAMMLELAEQDGDWAKAVALCKEMLAQGDARLDKNAWEQRLAYFQSKN